LMMDFIRIDERSLLLRALSLFKKENLSLEDCYNLIYARESKTETFKTFDVKLAKIFSATAVSE